MIKDFIKKIVRSFGYKVINAKDYELETISKYNKKLIKDYSEYTMCSDVKILSLIKAFEYINKFKIPGDFVECGIFTGGNLMLLKKLLHKYKLKKKIYGYDTFSGMTNASIYDIKIDGTNALKKQLTTKNWVSCSLESVKKNFKKKNLPLTNIKFVKGKVEETLKISRNLPKKISLLRLDTDFYESTKAELKYLYPLLSKGGVLLIDDYGSWLGQKKAVDEYFLKKKCWMHFIDHSARMIIKSI